MPDPEKKYYLTEELKKRLARPMLKFEPETAEQLAARVKKHKAEEEARIMASAQPGQSISDRGIFIGQWQPNNRQGKSLGKTFNVFAAPQDLTDALGKKVLLPYEETVKRVASLKNWHGHDGANFKNDTALYQALENDSYKGEWFIPTGDLLSGNDRNGKPVQPDNLYAHKGKGILSGTFVEHLPSCFSNSPHWYWACTAKPDGSSDSSRAVQFARSFSESWIIKSCRLSCRPVRVVEAPRP